MEHRDMEAQMLQECKSAAQSVHYFPANQKQANVLAVAASVTFSEFPTASNNLRAASERYFNAHPNERMTTQEVVSQGWIDSLPRLRNLLTLKLNGRESW